MPYIRRMRSPARWHPAPQAGAGSSSWRPARVDPREVASRLAPAVHWPGALDMGQRTWRLVARTADFDAWLIAWPSGGKVDLHDHGGSAGAVRVISGALVEAVPSRDHMGRLSLVHRELRAGASLGFGNGHVHDVTNDADSHALSLHVYSPALTSMTFYDMCGDQLVVRAVEWAADGCGEAEHPRAAQVGGAQSAAG
jgi:hypothetical protein